jgi:glutamate-1-semialdehyde aminotransferase
MVSMKATTKTTKKQPRPRTEQELLAEIKKLASELTDHNAQHRIRMAVQDIEDWRNGKDF